MALTREKLLIFRHAGVNRLPFLLLAYYHSSRERFTYCKLAAINFQTIVFFLLKSETERINFLDLFIPPAVVPVRFLTRMLAAMFPSSTPCIHSHFPFFSCQWSLQSLTLLHSILNSLLLKPLGKRWGDGEGVKGTNGRFCSKITSPDSLLKSMPG